MKETIPIFDDAHLAAICKVLADTTRGLKGEEIARVLTEMNVGDPDPAMTKWKRLFNALAKAQNHRNVGNDVIRFIVRAMEPVRYASDGPAFAWRRDELNVVLAFSGFAVGDDGKVRHTPKESTLSAAHARVGRMRAALKERCVHEEVLVHCREELVAENTFHAVLEATKGVAERIRELTGLGTDGADLVNEVFGVKDPMLIINDLKTDSEKSEQKGFSNLIIGLFGAVRNPLAHSPKLTWQMEERDALDVLTLVSFIHRKLDRARKPPT